MSDIIEQKCNFSHFNMLRNYVNFWTFFNPKNWIADENQLFPCLDINSYTTNPNATENGDSGIDPACYFIIRIHFSKIVHYVDSFFFTKN